MLRGTLRWLAHTTIWRYEPTVIGVTGSVGKTSTKIAIATVLSSQKNVRVSLGNLNSELGVALTILGEWKPSDLKLVSRDQPAHTAHVRKILFWAKVIVISAYRLVFRSKKYPDVLILEYGADKPGDIKYLLTMAKPSIALITAVGEIPVHVEFYAGPEEVAREKAKLIEALPAAGYAILNGDDETVLNVKERTRAHIMTFGFAKDADVRVSRLETRMDDDRHVGISFKLEYGGAFGPVRLTGAFGRAHAYAAAAAGAVGIIFGMNLVAISEALGEYVPAPARMKFMPGIKHTFLLDDTYNASPLSMHAALDTLRELPGKRKVAVLGDMLEIGKYSVEAHEGIGDLAAPFLDGLFTIGPRAKFIASAAIEGGMKKANVFSFDTADEAKLPVQSFIKEGDVVLLKGSHAVQVDKVVEEIRVTTGATVE